MDMLKGIITMEYKKLQAGRNIVIFSVFPDLNGARFMAANSSDGVTLHTVSSSSPRIFLKKRIFDILFYRTMDFGFGKKKMNEIDYLIKLVKMNNDDIIIGIQENPIDVNELITKMKSSSAGALSIFLGILI
jgi:hypothetical protein